MRLMFSARAIDRMAGGVERMIIVLMNAMVDRGQEVDLLTWDLHGAEAFYPMSPEIKWHQINIGDPSIKATIAQMVARAQAVRRLVRRRQPQVMVCFQDGMFLANRAYTAGLGIPVVAAERNAPTRFEHTSAGRSRAMIFQCLRSAALITIQCPSFRELYPRYLHPKIACIPNPVSQASRFSAPGKPTSGGRFRLLSVGRLSYQKNYQALIEAFAKLASTFTEWDLHIVGEGKDRNSLEALVERSGMAGRVLLPGASQAVSDHYAGAHLFCLPSRWEGFPNALAEALAHGLPSVGFAGCAGVKDLVMYGQNGLLAEGNGNADTLAGQLAELMRDPERRTAMSRHCIESVRRFEPEEIFARWEETLAGVASS